MSGETMEILLGNLENGGFIAGLRFYADKSNNWHTRLALSKLLRGMEKATEEPFKEYQDMVREFGKKNAQGNMFVSPAALTKERADQWEVASEAWREKTVKVESDLFLEGKLTVKLPKEVLNTMPYQYIEAMMDNVAFEEVVESKEDETTRLRKERDKALKDLEAKA